MEQQELSYFACGNAKWHSYFGRQFGSFFQNETHFYQTVQQLHSLVLRSFKGVENLSPCRNYTQMFITALFIIAKTWKQPTYPSVGEWINKLWYIQAMEYSVLKRNELSSHERTWRNLKYILLSERSQSEKATYCMIPII